MTWASAHIGDRHEPTLAGNCLAHVRNWQRDDFAKSMGGMLSVFRAAFSDGIDSAYREIAKPVDGCLVLMGTPTNPAAHIGMWCAEAKRVIHAKDSFGSVVAEELRMVRLVWSSVRFYEVPA